MTQPLVVMGISGSGKSTVGAALAARLAVPFADADDLHPATNVAKMARGEALDDDDRWPWLEEVARWLGEHATGGVMSCSALRRSYRAVLRRHAPVGFVHLAGDREVIERRVHARTGHFMPVSLLDSQLATLEPLAADEDGVVVDVDQTVEEIVEEALAELVRRNGDHPQG
ncbi:gluconokinase [Nocardioides sp. SYSU DS0663]|uniref:gluconokinase n=1 Tax=Nocardioides sp. SYSU DS0663 TaxID=3416445 RepID=UPI003F4BEA4E